MKGMPDFSALPETDRLSFYSVLIAVAASDGHIGAEERAIIEKGMEQASGPVKTQLQAYFAEPPQLEEALQALADASEVLRFNLMIGIINIVWADETMEPGEQSIIKLAQEIFHITDEQVQAIAGFIREIKRVESQEKMGNEAAAEQAIAQLTAAGIPPAALQIHVL